MSNPRYSRSEWEGLCAGEVMLVGREQVKGTLLTSPTSITVGLYILFLNRET